MGKPGDHPITDLEIHNLEICGRDVDAEMLKLLARFPESKPALIRLLESREFGEAQKKIKTEQRKVHDKVIDIWNAHMREVLKK